MLVLKRLDDALAQGCSILAVIRGSAVNHDGRSSSLTAPHGAAQQAVARAALSDAGVSPGEIDFLEAHGSGTPLGDPIEIEAAMAVYGQRETPLLVGSVKTNIGHLEAAAGAVGLLKAALAVSRKEVPAHLHFRQIHPGLSRFAGRMTVPTRTVALVGAGPHRGAVTSLGMGGTNAAMIVESPPLPTLFPNPPLEAVLCLSARTAQALQELRSAYLDLLQDSDEQAPDLGFTSTVGREHFPHRLAVVGADPAQLAAELRRASAASSAQPRVAFLFTGQGALHSDAGRELFQSEPVFREAFCRCAGLLEVEPETLFAKGPRSQPALFALEWSLAQQWMAWGVVPEWLLGHSLGEYVAACLAGVFSLPDALRLVAARGRLMDSLPAGGGMLTVSAGYDQVLALVGSRPLDLAARNGPLSTVVSGAETELEDWKQELERAGVEWRRLSVPTAFHSRWLDPIVADFERELSSITFGRPRIDIVSTVTGRPLSAEQACSVAYWSQGLRQPVVFQAAISRLAEEGANVFLEVGPHPVLCALGQGCLEGSPSAWVASLRRGQPERRQMLEGLGHLYKAGIDPDWLGVYSTGPNRRVALPTYPFQVSGLPGQPAADAPAGKPTIEAMIAATLGGEAGTLGADDNLLDHGLDSLRVMQLIADVARYHGRHLSLAEVVGHPTIAGISSLLEQTEPASPLVELDASGAGVPLFCLHPAGGQIGVYLQLRSPERPLYAIESRGLQSLDSEAATLALMVEDYTDLIAAARPQGPLALLGWSFGAMVALATAAALEKRGREIHRVTMIDPPRPGLKVDLAGSVLAVLHTHNPKPPSLTELRRKAGKLSLESVWELCLREGWLKQVSQESFVGQVQLHRRHVDMLKGFSATPIQAPLSIWWAKAPSQPEWWRSLSGAAVQQTTLGGDHYSVVRPPRVEKIIQEG